MAALRLVPASGSPIEINQDQVLVGREPTCDVVLNDGSVSRKHARLEKRGRTWTVVDQGSANGTFVDSQRVAETVLRSGQEVRFGALTFRVEIEGEEAIEATMFTDAPEATVMQSPPPPPAAPPPRPPAPPVPAARPPAASPPPPPPPPPVRPAAVPPTGSLPPGSIPPRVTGPARPPSPAPGPTARPVVPPVEAPAPPKKGKGPLFWIATGCCGCALLSVLVVALIGGAAFHMTSDAVAAVRAQLADLKGGNVDVAYQRFSDTYRARVSQEEFAALVSRHAGLRENADSTFWKRSVQNDRAEISGMLTSTSGAREMVTYFLVKEGGAWKISNIEFDDGQPSS